MKSVNLMGRNIYYVIELVYVSIYCGGWAWNRRLDSFVKRPLSVQSLVNVRIWSISSIKEDISMLTSSVSVWILIALLVKYVYESKI